MSLSEELKKAFESAEEKIEITIDSSPSGERDVIIRTDDEIDNFDIGDIRGWSLEQLQSKLKELDDLLDELEDLEPDEDEDGEEEYEEWEDRYSELEDVIYALRRRIAELKIASTS